MLARMLGRVTRNDAREVAHKACLERGWAWAKPVSVTRSLWTFHVMTNAAHRGGNANIWVSARSGRVTRAAFAGR